ncbi:hypothetical protein HaLaN_25508, partial [Haematococcus lacustris]
MRQGTIQTQQGHTSEGQLEFGYKSEGEPVPTLRSDARIGPGLDCCGLQLRAVRRVQCLGAARGTATPMCMTAAIPAG